MVRSDIYGQALLTDSACARQTGYALDRTVSALEKARDQIHPLTAQWETITHDWVPEWWDHAAEDLNRRARDIMRESDAAIAAAREYIAAPQPLNVTFGSSPKPIIEDSRSPSGSESTAADGQGPMTSVPPVPGYDPLTRITGTPGLATLPGAPQIVPAVPGQPVSMLPIAPGSPFAPFGGAYILPGPGIGPRGYVVPMPPNPGIGRVTMGSQGSMPSTASGAAGASGMMPVPVAGGQGPGSAHAPIYRRPNVTWEVGKGVPPVIRVEHDDLVPDRPSLKQEEEFRDWFSDLAYPWRANFKDSEGAQITVRTVPE
jgi:hypothetical protein